VARVHPSPWSWQAPAPELAALAALGLAYAVAGRRLGTTRSRSALFAAGLVLAAAVVTTPVETIALHYLLAAHLFQNVALAEWAPGLLVLGLSPPMATAIARVAPVRWLTYPLAAIVFWLAAYAVWHVPAVYDGALRRQGTLIPLEHATYVLAGALLWWPVVHTVPHRMTAGAKAAYVFAAFLFASPIGLVLALVPNALYDFYERAPRLWGLTPLTDQQIAGMIMAGTESIVFFAVFAVWFTRFLAEEEAGYSPHDA